MRGLCRLAFWLQSLASEVLAPAHPVWPLYFTRLYFTRRPTKTANKTVAKAFNDACMQWVMFALLAGSFIDCVVCDDGELYRKYPWTKAEYFRKNVRWWGVVKKSNCTVHVWYEAWPRNSNLTPRLCIWGSPESGPLKSPRQKPNFITNTQTKILLVQSFLVRLSWKPIPLHF
jgi:hypothetical protein